MKEERKREGMNVGRKEESLKEIKVREAEKRGKDWREKGLDEREKVEAKK